MDAIQTQHNTTDKRNKVKGNNSQQEETHTEVNYVKENIFKKKREGEQKFKARN